MTDLTPVETTLNNITKRQRLAITLFIIFAVITLAAYLIISVQASTEVNTLLDGFWRHTIHSR